MWQLLRDNRIRKYKTFSYPIVTNTTSYIYMIEDSVAFRNFGNIWFDIDDHFDMFRNHLYRNHHYADNVGDAHISINEKNFLGGMQAPPIYGAGLKLFRGNVDITIFTPIALAANGQVRAAPCDK